MVSIPCNYSLSPRLPTKPKTHLPNLFPFPPLPSPKRRSSPHPLNAAVQTNLSGFDPGEPRRQQQQQIRTLFPGGFKRPEIKVPALVLSVSSKEVLGRDDSVSAISVAVSKGVGIVVLDSKGDDAGGGRLYEAACTVKEVVGDRAYFLISERVDVASAVGASGVVLSDQGIPAIVARNMMMKSKSDAVYLPLVARKVLTADSAVNASSSEGADFLIISNMSENYPGLLGNFATQHVKVPIFFTITDSIGEDFPEKLAQKLLQSGISGIVMSLDDLKLFGDDAQNKTFSAAYVANRKLKDGYPNTKRLVVNNARNVLNEEKGIAGFTKLNVKEIKLIEEEKLLLNEAVTVIRRAAPTMKEVALLVDATSRLTQPFMPVIVGEFNSGKSTVINALLGKRYLKEGVVPTTNEITLLSYSETDFDDQERCERHPDGQFICYLSAPILKDMNLVDTPGTNVILQRQQRLTEEFVPRADLILFILSSDRPLTESEVAFLLYVQQWKKKVVFVLNKLDLYRDTSELEEAITFIKENTRKLLNAEDIRLYPVSARSALEAKLSASNCNRGNYQEILFNDPRWMTSKFNELEKFLFSFLDGSTVTGMERMRLKLETPINIADRLLTSCVILVKEECEIASQDLMSIRELISSVKMYAMKMESESISWRKHIASTIETAKARTIELIESTLQLSNIDLISTYALKGEKSGSTPATSSVQNEIISPTLTDTQRLLEEYSMWLQSSTTREGKQYLQRFYEQWHAFVDNKDAMQLETYELLTKGDEFSIRVINNFSASAASRLFENEIREIVLGTFGGLGAAGLSASLLTSVLPTTLEDLLALAFCSAGGFVAISNFPARRREAIEKVRKVADGLAREIDEAMQKELTQAMEKLGSFVEVISKPYCDAAQSRIDRLLETQDELVKVEGKLQNLKVKIQNLHVS